MLKLKVNDKDIEVEEGLTVLQACEQAGGDILGVMPNKLTKKEIGRKSIRSSQKKL